MATADCGFSDDAESGSSLLSRFGPTLGVRIGFDPAFRPAGQAPPALPADQLPALVDTGAAQSCIDNDLALVRHLPVVDRQEIAGAHGSAEVNMYLGQIRVPSLQVTIYGRFAGVALRAGGQAHFALIGRTFLRYFAMTYDGRTGIVTLSND